MLLNGSAKEQRKGIILKTKNNEVLNSLDKKYRIVINTTGRVDILYPSYLRGTFYTRYVKNTA